MRYPKHPVPLRGPLLVLLAVVALGPGGVHAQDTTTAARDTAVQDAPVTVDDALVLQMARVHTAIAEARDEFHGEVARVHDAEGRARAREEVDARIEEIFAEHEVTREEYDDFILRISLDGDLRTAFEEAMTRLEEDPSAPA